MPKGKKKKSHSAHHFSTHSDKEQRELKTSSNGNAAAAAKAIPFWILPNKNKIKITAVVQSVSQEYVPLLLSNRNTHTKNSNWAFTKQACFAGNVKQSQRGHRTVPLQKHRLRATPDRNRNPKHLSATRKLWCSWSVSAPEQKYTWPFSGRISSELAPQANRWFSRCGGIGKECVDVRQGEEQRERNELSGLLTHLQFSVQNQKPFTAVHLKSSRKPLPQTRVLCQFWDSYSILCWFWMQSQHWLNHGNWVTALNLERQPALLNAFK